MGILDIFRSKEQHITTNKRIHAIHNHVSDAFSNVHTQLSTINEYLSSVAAEITKQSEWLKYLHQNHLSLNNQHTDHKVLTKGEVQRINSWILHLNKAIQKQEKQISEIQKVVEDSTREHDKGLNELYGQIEKTHKIAREKPPMQIIEKEVDHDAIAQRVLENLNIDIQALQANVKQAVRQDVYNSVLAAMQEEHDKHKGAIEKTMASLQRAKEEIKPKISVQPMAQIHPQKEHQLSSQLTNPEQKLLNILISEADPLTYAKVSQLTGHSINTIRVNMNVLKKKGLVEESTLPTGIKLFSVLNKERIKKMYNVSLL